ACWCAAGGGRCWCRPWTPSAPRCRAARDAGLRQVGPPPGEERGRKASPVLRRPCTPPAASPSARARSRIDEYAPSRARRLLASGAPGHRILRGVFRPRSWSGVGRGRGRALELEAGLVQVAPVPVLARLV